jgi:ankyrin repeat protein
MAVQRHDLNDRLVAAVTARDSDAARASLEDGADPDTRGPDGLPLLCAAASGFDHETAEALTEGGAEADRELPDGTTPLLQAVSLGSPALVDAMLGKDPRMRFTEAAQQLLSLARHWYETGEAEELRRRTGASDPATRRLIEDTVHTSVEEVSLGGLTVRAGHSAILTMLESTFGVLPPATELVARAIPHPDETHVNWSAASYTLARRRGLRTWSELASLAGTERDPHTSDLSVDSRFHPLHRDISCGPATDTSARAAGPAASVVEQPQSGADQGDSQFPAGVVDITGADRATGVGDVARAVPVRVVDVVPERQ